MNRSERRWLRTTLAVCCAYLTVTGFACSPAATSGPAPPLQGSFVYVAIDGFWTWDLSTRSHARLTTFPDGTFASAPAVSPDGSFIAFCLSRFGTGAANPGGTELDVMKRDGSAQQRVVTAVAPAESPAWAPDGQSFFVTRRGAGNQDQIERVAVDGSESVLVVPHASGPAVSPDAMQLVYVMTDRRGEQRLWTARADGSAERPLIGNSFTYIQDPHFSRDGKRLAFVAGGASGAQLVPEAATQPRPFSKWMWAAAASAHGVPLDVWIVDRDGANLRRLTQLDEHIGYPNWSADGRWIAFTGEPGMYVVDDRGERVTQLSNEGLPSGLTWLPDRS